MHKKKDLSPKPPKPKYIPGSGMNTSFEEIFKGLDQRRNGQVGIFPRMVN
jgi:hypothetical protein